MRVMVAAGGSGGHVFPALCVLEELRAQGVLTEAGWFGRPDSIEQKILEKRPWIAFFPLSGRGLPRERPWIWPAALVCNARSLGQARRILRSFQPHVLLAMGGYLAVAPTLAAKTLGIPVAIHEQNAQMGVANRFLTPWADLLLLSFPHTLGCPKNVEILVTGTPVRPAIASITERLGSELLVLGGSLGSRGLLEAVKQAAPMLSRIPGLKVRLSVGRAADPSALEGELRKAGLEARAFAFVEGMDVFWRRARLVLARAGASTLAELACAGRPAILVPWEGSANGHQLRNASYFASRGAAILLREKDLPRTLGPLIAELWSDEGKLGHMAAAARSLARPDAAGLVAQALLALTNGKEPR